MPTWWDKLLGWRQLEGRHYEPLARKLAERPDYEESGSLLEFAVPFFREYRKKRPKVFLFRDYQDTLPENIGFKECLYKVKKAKGGLIKIQIKAKGYRIESGLFYAPGVRTNIVGEREGRSLNLIHTATMTKEKFQEIKRELKI